MAGADGMGFMFQQIGQLMDTGIWNRLEDEAGMGIFNRRLKNTTDAQKQMTDYNYAKQLQMQRDSFEQEMKLWEENGINKGLMYKSGAPGGATIQAASQPNSSAPERSASTGMGMASAAIGAGQLQQQQPLIDAQVENVKANTNLTNVEAEKKKGVDTANVTANTRKQNAEAAFKETEVAIQNDTYPDAVTKIQAEAGKLRGEMNSALAKGEVDQRTVDEQEQIINTEAINVAIDTQLKRAQKANIISQTEYNNAKTKAVAEEIAAMWQNTRTNSRNADYNKQNADTNMYRQIQDKMYQNGMLDLMDRKELRETILGIIDIVKFTK